jgi:hypothetical protein
MHIKYLKLKQNDEDFDIRERYGLMNLKNSGDSSENEENNSEQVNTENSELATRSRDQTNFKSRQHKKLIIILFSLICVAFLFFVIFIFGHENIFQKTFSKVSSIFGRNQLFIGDVNEWSFSIESYGTESCIRVYDIDQDGLDDLIFGLAGVDEINMIGGNNSSQSYNGLLMGVRGLDGKLLWKIETKSEIFELNCNLIDINKVIKQPILKKTFNSSKF